MAFASLDQTSSPAEEFPLNPTFLQRSLGVNLVLPGPFSRAERWLSTTGRPLVALGQAAL